MNKRTRNKILVTNDDGYQSQGISTLIEILRPFGDLLVVAPEKGQSGMGHAITMKDPLRLNIISDEPGLKVYTCSGTSVDCVKMALNHICTEKPDFLFSGINHGTNSAISIIYSGTMGAALEGAIHNIPSIGLSVLDHSENPDLSGPKHYTPQILNNLLTNGHAAPGLCLNINFPKIGVEEIKGFKVARQANSLWVEEFDRRVNPHHKEYFWLTGKFLNREPEAQDTDVWALANNYISVVPVKVDFTDHEKLNSLKNIIE